MSQEVQVVKGLPAEWGKCSCTVSLNSHGTDLSYWKDNIAVGSGVNIIIFNAITGSQIAILSDHTYSVQSITYSSDGMFLVSGCGGGTVKLWDVQTGGVVKTFHGHTDCVCSVSISADNTRIASGSLCGALHLWNTHTGECHCVIKQEGIVIYVSFSPINSQHLLSISGKKGWQWDINGHQAGPTYDGSCISFSPDGTQFILCHNKAVTVQDSNSGVIVNEFQIANGSIYHCCFSPDGRLFAVASQATIYVWDVTGLEPHLAETFIGHTEKVNSLIFSSPSSLISASDDKSVKF